MKPQNLIKKCWLLAPLQTIENLSNSEIAYYFSLLNAVWRALRTHCLYLVLRHGNFQAYLFPRCTCSSVWLWGTYTVMAHTESLSQCDCTVFLIQTASASCLQAKITFHQQGKGGWGQWSPVREKAKLCWSKPVLRSFSLESDVSVECAFFIIITLKLTFLLLALFSVISGTRYHLEDANNTWKTPGTTTELEERLKAPEVQTEKAKRHFRGNFQTCSSIVGWRVCTWIIPFSPF